MVDNASNVPARSITTSNVPSFTSQENGAVTSTVWKSRYWTWLLSACGVGLLVILYFDALKLMAQVWESEEYSHGYMLPFVTAFFIWQKSTLLAQMPFRPSWLGVLVVSLGLFAYIVGDFATLQVITQYAFLITLGGLLLSLMGWSAFKIILPACVLLFFLVPFPDFLYNNLSAKLQLISSQLGVAFIRLFGEKTGTDPSRPTKVLLVIRLRK